MNPQTLTKEDKEAAKEIAKEVIEKVAPLRGCLSAFKFMIYCLGIMFLLIGVGHCQGFHVKFKDAEPDAQGHLFIDNSSCLGNEKMLVFTTPKDIEHAERGMKEPEQST